MAAHPVTMHKNHEKQCIDMSSAIWAVQKLLSYNFKDQNLLEMALTHSSYTHFKSYQHLEFVGHSALDSVIATSLYLANPDHDPHVLSLVKAANTSTERLACVAIRSGLYKYVRHNSASLVDQVFLQVFSTF